MIDFKDPKNRLYFLVCILTIASVAYRLIYKLHIYQTSFLFVGLPALITILYIKYGPKPKSMFGVVFKVITIFLLMSAILLGEGTVCILIASPLFYGIAAVCVSLYNHWKRDDTKFLSLLVLPYLLIIAQPFAKRSEKIISVETKIMSTRNISFADFNLNPNLKNNLPAFFQIGFPKPVSISGAGLKVGDLKIIKFESKIKNEGILVLKVIDVNDKKITFQPIKDNTKINEWLSWEKIEVEVKKTQNNVNQITWKSSYKCNLGPQWYFEPIETFAVDLMNLHLLKSFFN